MIDVESSKIELLIATLGLSSRPSGAENLAIEECPFCLNSNYKFYIHKEKGVWNCKVCGKSGTLTQLKEKLGVTTQGISSIKDSVPQQHAAPLPDFDRLHLALMGDERFAATLDHLVCDRQFSIDVIRKYKLGAWVQHDKVWYVIPYFGRDGKGLYYKARTVPPEKKDFTSPAGRDAPLFNGSCLKKGIEVLYIVEGESDALAMLSQGFEFVIGVPGAGVKKAIWIEQIDALAPKAIYLLYDRDKPGQDAAREMASRIGIEKCKNILLPEFTTTNHETGEPKPGKDITEWFCDHTRVEFYELESNAKAFDVTGVQSVGEVLEELERSIEERGTLPKYSTPWPSLNKRLGGCEDGDLVGIMAEGKVGKAQPLDATIMTTTGRVTMGEIQVGDYVASIDGSPSQVSGVFPQGVKDMYRVTFCDGRTTRCCAEHLWSVQKVQNSWEGYRTLTTAEIQALLNTEINLKLGKDKLYVPLCNGEFGSDGYIPLDPWLLGVLIGDGGLLNPTPRIHKQDADVRRKVQDLVWEYGCTTTTLPSGFSIRRIFHTQQHNFVAVALRHLGLYGKGACSKFIPEVYMNATRHTRARLLSGLLDTDGCISVGGHVSFSTSSEALALDTQRLVRSLGGVSKIAHRPSPKYSYKGEVKTGQPAYRVSVSGLDRRTLFSVQSKAVRANAASNQARLSISSIEHIGKEQAQCISVTHASQLYITDDYIVTHNTTFALNWLQYFTEQGHNCLMYCLEMPPSRMVRKWVSNIMQADDTPFNSKITPDVIKAAAEKGRSLPGELLFGYTRGGRPQDVFDTIRQAVRRYGVKVVCFDHLQLLCRSIEHQATETSKLVSQFKELAMELGILLLLIIQPNRVQEGSIVASRNASGSSAIEKIVDSMICLHRNRVAKLKESEFKGYMDTDDNLEPHMLTRVDLSRYAPGGVCTLYMDGARSTVREIDNASIAAALEPRSTEIPIYQDV